jgi:hypothetical protein
MHSSFIKGVPVPSTSSHGTLRGTLRGTPGQAGQAGQAGPALGDVLPNISAKSAISAIRGVGRPKVLKDGRFEGMDVRAAAAK